MTWCARASPAPRLHLLAVRVWCATWRLPLERLLLQVASVGPGKPWDAVVGLPPWARWISKLNCLLPCGSKLAVWRGDIA